MAALLVLGLLLVLLILVNGGAWVAFRRFRSMLEHDLEARMITTGQTVAATLNAVDFLILNFRDENDKLDLAQVRDWRADRSYGNLITLLDRVKAAADLRSISIVLSDGRVVADPDDIDVVGETRPLLALDIPEMKRAETGAPAAGPLYPVDEVLYKRVYVPVFDEDGNVLALLRLEASSEYFVGLQRVRASLAILLLVSTVVLVAVSFVLYRLIGRLILTERAASQADRLRSLGTLAAGLAHEIRNPLAIIRLTCEELRITMPAPTASTKTAPDPPGAPPVAPPKSAPPAAPISEALDDESPAALVRDIQEEVGRLEALVEQFLSFARPEASQSALGSGKPADPVAAVRHVTRLFEKSLRVTKIRLRTFFPPEPLPRVFLSEKSLSQVVLNLLRNAQEALPSEGGQITVTLREHGVERTPTAADDSSASSQSRAGRRPPSRVEIAVEDTGPGMPESVRRQAFDPFFSTKENGTGLGLALVLRLVTSAGGDVELESKPGRGTTVRLLLPVARIEKHDAGSSKR